MAKTLVAREQGCESGGFNFRKNGDAEGFVEKQVLERGLDERTAQAYRTDLKKFILWTQEQEDSGRPQKKEESCPEKVMEDYLEYLVRERGMKHSTVTRKGRVLGYYLQYLSGRGILPGFRAVAIPSPADPQEQKAGHELSRAEVDAFFQAMDREHEQLKSDFRKRICLRDSVMMGLLFYLGIEISELLRLKASDYNRRTGVLTIRGKRGKDRQEYLYSRDLREKMERWLEERRCFEAEGKYQDLLIVSRMGKPLSMKMVVRIFDKYRELAGIEKEATPKDLKCGMKRYARELLVERCS